MWPSSDWLCYYIWLVESETQVFLLGPITVRGKVNPMQYRILTTFSLKLLWLFWMVILLGPRSAHSQTRPSLPSPKPKRSRTSFTPTQLERLEEEFSVDMYVVGLKRMKLANELNLSERQVKVWFQNRRMKYKRERAKSRSDGGKLNWADSTLRYLLYQIQQIIIV